MRGVLGAVRRWFDPEEVRRVGTTPDYRYSLANERTFLAWIRTGLALLVLNR
jgi:putative membrane protein